MKYSLTTILREDLNIVLRNGPLTLLGRHCIVSNHILKEPTDNALRDIHCIRIFALLTAHE